MTKLVHGVGINDADYVVEPRVNGKRVRCPFYLKWRNMLERCYSPKSHIRCPTYIGCTTSPDWIVFSNFRRWMESQDWQGKHLDKDFLIPGNRIYSPQTCAFVDALTNTFITESGSARGEWPLGVDFHKKESKIRARINNPFSQKSEHLGYFSCRHHAHQAWRKRKHELACQLAEMQEDHRVSMALRTRYI